MKADFDGPGDTGDRPPANEGWVWVTVVGVGLLILAALGVVALSRS
jgi:hypothetical protein